MRNINLRYVEESYDEKGMLESYRVKYPETFNFAYDVVDDIAQHDPDRVAMVWCNPEGEEKTFTFAEVKRYSDKAANVFRAQGIEKGDTVLVTLKRHYQFWFIITALHKLGAVIIPASFLLTKHDIIYRIQSSSAKGVVCTCDGDVSEHYDSAIAECDTVQCRWTVNGQREGWRDFDAELEEAPEELERVATLATEPMLLYFSSGTSGYPKMVMHDYTYALGHILTAKHWHNVNPEGLHLSIADTGWGKAVWGKYYGQWIMEAPVFIYDFERFVPADILSKVEQYKITTLCCPPTMFRMMLLEDLSRFDLSSLEYCTIAGEALNPDVFNNWYQQTGIKLMEGFGQTETTVTIANLKGMEPKPGSMGKPVPQYRVEVVDEEGNPVPPGVTGEIVIYANGENDKPVGLFNGYHRAPDRTLSAWHDGLYHTGDTAWKDEDGYYWYVGRTDDLIKSSGYRIGPFEIESVLMEHPAILECAVTGVPDPLRGQLVKASVVLREGYTPSDQLVKEIQDFVKKETAPYKYPRIIDFLPELPKTVNGKIRRVEIRDKDSQ